MAYKRTERTGGGIDWDAAERDFIENTSPRTGYREFAESSAEKIWSGRQPITYIVLKDVGKERMWMRKRAEFQREKHASLFVDAEIVYGFIMNILVRDGETLSSVDLARLTNEMIKLQDLLMHHEPTEERVDDRELITRDELLDEFERWERPTVDDLLKDALANLEDEDV
jgi:hypothetical protein